MVANLLGVTDREHCEDMSGDPFGLPTKKKMVAYGCIAGAILVAGCGVAIYQGTPLRRVLLLIGLMVIICGGPLAAMIWLSGGRRTEAAVGPAGVRPPVRMMKALPYMLGLIALIYLVKAIAMISSR